MKRTVVSDRRSVRESNNVLRSYRLLLWLLVCIVVDVVVGISIGVYIIGALTIRNDRLVRQMVILRIKRLSCWFRHRL